MIGLLSNWILLWILTMMFNQPACHLLTTFQLQQLRPDALLVDGALCLQVCIPINFIYVLISKDDLSFIYFYNFCLLGGSSTNNLQYVRVPAITNAQCNSAYGGSITDAMICAGYPGVGGKDACQGDSGGPFVCNDNGNAVIAGVVSWGNGCALADFPGVYARTTTALSWIQSNMVSHKICNLF